jgi:predicted ArsR family transcriptional regulator
MLEGLLGNSTVEKTLLFIHAYGQGHAKGVADALGLTLSAVQRQMRRLENGGILVSRLAGKTRLYEINPRWPFGRELAVLLEKALAFLPAEQRGLYEKRTRPRRAGKP